MIRRALLRTLITLTISFVAVQVLYLISDKINVLEKFSVTLNDIDFTDLYYQYTTSEVPTDTNIVIVNFGMLPREDIGRLINKISGGQPRVIAADIFFDELNDKLNPAGTDTLVDQIRGVKNLVLVTAYRGLDRLGRDSVETQSPRVREFAEEGLGNFNIPKDDPEYGTLRSFTPYIQLNGEWHLSFAFKIASYFDSTLINYSHEDEMFIRWYGYAFNKQTEGRGRSVFPAFDWHQVFRPDFDNKVFSDKIVVLGYLGAEIGAPALTGELYYSPMNHKIIGRSAPDLYGTELHANAIKMIIDRDFVKQSWLADFGYGFCFLVALTVLLDFLKTRYDKYYAVLSKLILLVAINAFVFSVVGFFYATDAQFKILIGESLVVMLIVPDTLDFLWSNLFSRLRLVEHVPEAYPLPA